MLLTIQQFYPVSLQIQFIISGIILFIGIQLILKPIPNSLKESDYYISRKIMGIAISILPILSCIYYFKELTQEQEYLASAIKLCGYYSCTSLVLIAFLALIGEEINLRSKKFKLYILSFFIFPLYIWAGLKYGNESRTLDICNTILFCSITGNIIYFYIKYKDAERRVLNTKNEEIKIHLEWIKKSKYMLIIFAVIACLSPTFFRLTIWVKVLYMVYTLIITTYIYESYNRFIIQYETLIKNRKVNLKKHKKIEIIKEDTPVTNLNKELYEQIKRELDNWVDKKLYLEADITIKTVASNIGTNRTYLSSYVNNTYNCSFKVWIRNLRLEEAKMLLCGEKEYTIETIANKVGFSSQTSFIHVFKNAEGLPPAAWKAEHKL